MQLPEHKQNNKGKEAGNSVRQRSTSLAENKQKTKKLLLFPCGSNYFAKKYFEVIAKRLRSRIT